MDYLKNIDHKSIFLIMNIIGIESNIIKTIEIKIHNFLLSINDLFQNNTYYINNILKYVEFIIKQQLLPIISTTLYYLKSSQLISEEHLNIKISNKKILYLFLILNSFESLLIKYIDKIFSLCYQFFFNSKNEQKVKYYGKKIGNIFKEIQNYQNLFFIMNQFKNFLNSNSNTLINKVIDIISCGYSIKYGLNIIHEIKNIYCCYKIKDENNNNFKKTNEENEFEEKELNENDICILCLNKFNEVCCTPCGHLFCWSCIHFFLIEKDFCPKCKQKCKPQEILFLQNYK